MSVLGLESGYTVKYGLSPLDFPWAQAIFYRISLLLSWYGYSIPSEEFWTSGGNIFYLEYRNISKETGQSTERVTNEHITSRPCKPCKHRVSNGCQFGLEEREPWLDQDTGDHTTMERSLRTPIILPSSTDQRHNPLPLPLIRLLRFCLILLFPVQLSDSMCYFVSFFSDFLKAMFVAQRKCPG